MRSVNLTSLFGFIDEHNQVIIDPIYEDATMFYNNRAIVSSAGHFLMIDRIIE
ncbi:WG repeat-containing protein [Paenibacillus sp. R14(2021)]|uniref:WG repeat-containing protein n=1 Tax=Paenibacillus sp. R14(2021) TaxID=2859228 RepID=UPI0035BE1BF6